MGWKENGKYGVFIGRIVCFFFVNVGGLFLCSVFGCEMEYFLKFIRGIEILFSIELDEFLLVNDIDDGFGDFVELLM